MSSPIRLHWFWSTNPEKIRLALEELGLEYERVKVDIVKGEHKSDRYRAIHPRQKVPALEIDGVTLWESGAILAYLGEREGRLWPDSNSGRATALNLLFMEGAAFQDLAGVFFFNRKVLPSIGKEGDPQRVAAAQKKIDPLLHILSETLGEEDYLLGDFSLVDLAYAPWLPGLDLDAFPAVAAWRARLMSREAWVRSNVAAPDQSS